jgi:uncharacterized protein YfbU (UPF0304 family)
MKLDLQQRLSLYNQYEILKRLDPDQAKTYSKYQSIVSSGFEGSYFDLFSAIDEDAVPLEVCKEVTEILNLFRALEFAQRKAGYSSQELWAKFQGFDGNDEPMHYSYAVFLVQEDGRWGELKGQNLNSHFNVLDKYRAMLREWKQRGGRYELQPEDVEAIAKA